MREFPSFAQVQFTERSLAVHQDFRNGGCVFLPEMEGSPVGGNLFCRYIHIPCQARYKVGIHLPGGKSTAIDSEVVPWTRHIEKRLSMRL